MRNCGNKLTQFFESGDEERAITLFTELADRGDWRGANMLGYIFQEKGRKNQAQGKAYRPDYLVAARWYRQALSQEEHNPSHYGLAYYYYGLGGKSDYKLAFEHLEKSCLEEKPMAQVMMAELLWRGRGVPQDVDAAKKLFRSAADAGYPAGLAGLARIAKVEGRFVRAIVCVSLSLNYGL